MIQNVLKQ